MAAEKTTILHRFALGPGPRAWLLIFGCGHWLKWMSPIGPVKGEDMTCPQCNIPKVGTGPVDPAGSGV